MGKNKLSILQDNWPFNLYFKFVNYTSLKSMLLKNINPVLLFPGEQIILSNYIYLNRQQGFSSEYTNLALQMLFPVPPNHVSRVFSWDLLKNPINLKKIDFPPLCYSC